MNLLSILLAVAAALVVASVLAVATYGRFAKRSRGGDSFAFDDLPVSSELDRLIAERIRDGVGKSGLALVSDNLDAFAIRALTARSCGRSLDLMYYYWKDDLTGRLLAREIVDAADRGVRVRLLIDDINTRGRDKAYVALDGHPSIEVRLFNPSRARQLGIRRGVEMILRAFTINRRMHNKAWTADGRLAVVGGRNIGDEYFDAGRQGNFRDMDVAVTGPAVRQVEEVFDRFWNSAMTMPITALVRRPQARLERLRRRFAELDARADCRPFLDRVLSHPSLARFLDADLRLHWAGDVKIIADPPEKATGRGTDNWMMKSLLPVLESADREVSVTSPYFVPGKQGVARLTGMVDAGIAVTVLTNSLAATDVAAVHGGYARYRKPLVEGGVRLFELQPFMGRERMSLFGSRAASLHTKAFTIDGEIGFIGSFNFDPRSASLNTEMGVLFVMPDLVAEMDAIFAREITPQMSWRLSLAQDGRLRWTGETDGLRQQFDHEPKAGVLQRLVATIVGWLPIESQL